MLSYVGILLVWMAGDLLAAPSPVVARVNGRPIFEEELVMAERPIDDSSNVSREAALDRLVLFHLAVQEAKRLGLDKKPAVRHEVNKVLYQSLLEAKRRESKVTLEPSTEELQAYYEKNPWLRLRHLAIVSRTPQEKETAEKTIREIRERAQKGEEFKALVLEHSQDQSAQLGGDLDFRGVHSLHPDFYRPALQLKKGEISPPIEAQGGLHLLELVDRVPFGGAPASYLELLRGRLRSEREEALLVKILGDLKKKARIELSARK